VIQSGPFAGAEVVALNPALADRLGGDPFATGVIVTGVSGRGYAARAGFRQNDLIVSINGRPIAFGARRRSRRRRSRPVGGGRQSRRTPDPGRVEVRGWTQVSAVGIVAHERAFSI
jgi:hypothetical protein